MSTMYLINGEYYMYVDGKLELVPSSWLLATPVASKPPHGAFPSQNNNMYGSNGSYDDRYPVPAGGNYGSSSSTSPVANPPSMAHMGFSAQHYSNQTYGAVSAPTQPASNTDFPPIDEHFLVADNGHRMRCSCGADFTAAKSKHNRSNFKRHLAAQVAAFPCEICDAVFNPDDNLRTHRRTVHLTPDQRYCMTGEESGV